MKRIIALTLMLCMLFGIGGFSAFADTLIFNVHEHWGTNIVIFYNADDIFSAATICYCADGSENWQSAEMTYGGKNEYWQDSWYITMPEGKYRYYITDGTHRTQEQYFYFENLLYLLNETNENGYYELCLDAICREYTEPAWLSEMIAGAANELYRSRTPFPAEDIVMEYSYRFKDSSLYAVRFMVKDYVYVSIELVENFGDWLLYSGYLPEPYIFADQKLYTVKEAYEGGIITDAQLEELSRAAGHTGFYLTRSIKGDADGDGACNIIDATVIQRYDAYIIGETEICKPLADVDGDNSVSVIDATLIQRSEAGMYTIQ